MERKYRAGADIWIARIGTAFGWFWGVLYALVAVVGFCELPSAKDNLDVAMPFICLGLAAVHFLMVRAARKTRSLVGDFRYYSRQLAKDRSVASLCEKVKEPREEVERKLKEMCRRGYFRGHLDPDSGRLELEHTGEAFAARCPGCGATTRIYKTGDACRYCGNPLTAGDAPERSDTEPG